MKKKQYIQPLVEIVSADVVSFICGSGKPSGQLPNGKGTGQANPQPDSEGIIHGESKQSDSCIDWDNEDW